MSDGAHAGVGAEAAMKAILGGEQPTEVESTGQMRDRIMSTTIADATSYDGSATYIAKLVLSAYIANPALASVPAEGTYGYVNADGVVLTRDERYAWYASHPSGPMEPPGFEFTKTADGLWDVLKPDVYAAVPS